jgi:hypothetical protein
MNPVPVTVNVKVALPALVKAGEMPLTTGAGFATSTTWLTEFEVLPVKLVSPP